MAVSGVVGSKNFCQFVVIMAWAAAGSAGAAPPAEADTEADAEAGGEVDADADTEADALAEAETEVLGEDALVLLLLLQAAEPTASSRTASRALAARRVVWVGYMGSSPSVSVRPGGHPADLRRTPPFPAGVSRALVRAVPGNVAGDTMKADIWVNRNSRARTEKPP
ncbi:hypothetical protein GCM10009760_57560 [Kitasatospora kazusensis]|uniref:Uncharacterized protein n=1 Tax=Kitasatospora kazusensis TaxID=407974 RepID=A0ABN3A9I7_9ACTN